MNSIRSDSFSVHFGDSAFTELKQYVLMQRYSSIFVLVDENTKTHCLPVLQNFNLEFPITEVLIIPAGEENKNIATCERVWWALAQAGADRKSLLLNLGGGVLTDLGGFVASTYKRGIDFINVPTTLLAMVDASVGGKTGVDLGNLKNQIGVINQPVMVLVNTRFLNTLEHRQRNSGFAEMLKHGLIKSLPYWEALKKVTSYTQLDDYIYTSVQIKNEVVQEDPYEKGLRKILNYGHTLGHAIESYFLEQDNRESLLHGEAIAAGMILEAHLSHTLTGLSFLQCEDIKQVFLGRFGKIRFSETDIDEICELLIYDKKNSHGNINFVLLKAIGTCVLDVTAPIENIKNAFAYYKD